MAITRPDGTVERDFAYDSNGNMLAGNGRELRYNAANKPVEIRESGVTTQFAYGPDQARIKQTRGVETIYYIGEDYEYVISGSEVREKTYIGDHVVIEKNPTGRHVRYLHTDRMGSVDTITDESGAVVERHGYDPFGKPLTSDWEDAGGLLHSGEYATATTTRGFTAHEHLDAHALIHMGGRAYDPALGRFLSVDPIIQNPLSSQSLNPYSYILNNPLSGVDPTGYQCDPVAQDTAGCVDSEGHIITQPATAQPGNNGQQGQGVDAAGRGPATDQGKPGDKASSRPWYARAWSKTWRFIKREVAPRAAGAVKVGAGFATAALGISLCTTGLGCAAGGTLIVGAADVSGSGLSQMIHGAPQPSVIGQQFGPTAQTLEEFTISVAAVVSLGLAVRSSLRIGGESAAAGGGGREATGVLGSRRAPLGNAPYQSLQNADTVIGGRTFSGHALDQMRNRGVMPSAVENTIQTGVRSADPIMGRTRFFEPVNKITVITEGERVITVIPGRLAP